MLQDSNFVNIIPLARENLEAPLLSTELLRVVRHNKELNKKTLVFYNRRGTARAWMCEDCGFFEKCPHCDIALAYHTSPIKRLVCHQCNSVSPFPIQCPSCHGHKITGIGVGIERVVGDIVRILGDSYSVLRFDSDSRKKIYDLCADIDQSDVIVSTSLGSTIVHESIASVIFLSFEINLSIPEYDMEEQVFDEILFYKKQKVPIYIQTYTPDHPLIHEILVGNQKSFFHQLQKERRDFSYPPFSEFITIRVHHASQKNVIAMISHLVHKINLIKSDDIFIAFDKDIWEKRGGEWSQKIILKGKDLMMIVREIEIEVVRNRSVSLEWN